MYILASFVKDKVPIGAWIYLWAFCFVLLIYISVFVAGEFFTNFHVVIKNPPANTEDVKDMSQSLNRENPLEEEMATHSSILAWKIPWTEEPGGLQFMGSQRVRHD